MKRLIVMLMVLVFVGMGVAIAADMVTYNEAGKQGKVTFNHKAHSEKAACKDCHGDAAPAKIAIDKEKAHGAACKDCHKAKGGPTKCGDCHKK